LGDERVDRKHRQHGLQGAWHVDPGQLDQATPARGRIVGVDQHDAIAMAHRGQRVQQVGAKHGVEAEQHVSSGFWASVAFHALHTISHRHHACPAGGSSTTL
jgi:hypothetical protein